jgi:hypothetical protein
MENGVTWHNAAARTGNNFDPAQADLPGPINVPANPSGELVTFSSQQRLTFSMPIPPPW